MNEQVAKAYEELAWAVTKKHQAKFPSLKQGNEDLLPIRECDIEKINQALVLLGEKKHEILRMKFGLDDGKKWMVVSIARHFKITRATVYNQVMESLHLLRNPFRNYVFLRLFRSGLEECINSQTLLISELKKNVERLNNMLCLKERGGYDSVTAPKALLSMRIEDIHFSHRTQNHLKSLGVKTIGGLAQKTENELLASWGFGRKCLNEVKDALSILGLSLKRV